MSEDWSREPGNLPAGEPITRHITVTALCQLSTQIPVLDPAVSDAVNIPVIASGGCGTLEHIYEALTAGGASAALAASIFHYREYSVKETKEYLAERGVTVRL